ncbi:MAG: hypothetical protein IPL50_16475 [Chitinophagaceae bacterium]|nr:hypothetical protein [Chitinophagaceae bacterium]
MIPELLPECFEKTNSTPAPLWKINDANTFIDLVFCKYTQKKEKQFSLNPYIFMQVQGIIDPAVKVKGLAVFTIAHRLLLHKLPA